MDADHKSNDLAMTERALKLAGLGRGRVSPSPLVGCVIVSREGEIVGEGTYIFEGVTHAEVIALEKAGERARGGTAYVSLEPHSHHGRTPPCTEALIEHGISRVVCPVEDPNPLVSGEGFARLRAAGLEVVTGVLENEARRLNEIFFTWHNKKRPFVHLKSAITIDGKIATSGGESQWITSEEARAYGHLLRHGYDAILVGAGTVFADDPSLTDRSRLKRGRPLARVVLDSGLRTSPEAKVVRTATEFPTIIVSSKTSDDTEELSSKGVEIVSLAGGPEDLASVLDSLGGRGITSVLVEGGSRVAGSFLRSGFVDKFTFFIAPMIVGGDSAKGAFGGKGIERLADAVRLTDVSVEKIGGDIVVTGYPSD